MQDQHVFSAEPDVLAASGAGISWAHVIRRHAHLQPTVPAIRFHGRTLTFADLDDRIDRAATALAKLGVEPGDRIGVFAGNCPEMVETIGAAVRLGAIAVPINFRLVASEVAYILTDCDAAILITDRSRFAVAVESVEQTGRSIPVLVTGPERGDDRVGVASYETALRVDRWDAATSDALLAACQAESPAVIMYTSGTTGRPKGAVLSHLNLFVQTMTQVRTAQLFRADDVIMCASPIFHIAGLMGVLPGLLLGDTIVLMSSAAFDAEEVADYLAAEHATSVFLVPTQWQAICAVPDIRSRTFRLRTILWGGSPVLPSTLRAMEQTFPDAANVAVFGQTEMSPVTAYLEGADALRKLGSIGKPVATVDIRIVDEEMRDVSPGGVGEIVYQGPTVMLGYWNDPVATAAAMRGGWFHSGDLVRADDEGFLTVVDRAKDMIISGGENIYSAELEAVLDAHPGVAEVAIVGVPHPKWIETPVAVVVPTHPDAAPTVDELENWLTGRLASYKRPTAVKVLDALPRNALGKIRKNDLRTWLVDGGSPPR